jgi:hypothetical protein
LQQGDFRMTPQGPRIFTVNPQAFGPGRFGLSQASPFKRFILVLLLILVAIPLLALGMVILLIVITLALFRVLFQSASRPSVQSAAQVAPQGRGPTRSRNTTTTTSRKDDSMRENVKVIER